MDSLLVYRANTIIMGCSVWSAVKRHPKIISAVKGGLSGNGSVSRQAFADLMEIDVKKLLIGTSQVNMAQKGQPLTLERVWGDSAQLVYQDDSKSATNDQMITWGFTAELGNPVAGETPEPLVGLHGGVRVRVGESVREVVCAKDLGYQISNAV